MEAYYILIVGVLFLLAISDLVVGVSNDAVNFLNSALGSRVAPFKVIMAIAAVGVLVGAVFSNGMMEVARKGIFNPEMFAFSEIMDIKIKWHIFPSLESPFNLGPPGIKINHVR